MGISGGVLGGIVAYHYLPYESRIVFYAVSAVLAVVGICIQYAMKSSKIARLERKKAKEIRERNRWSLKLRWRETFWIPMNRKSRTTRRKRENRIRK